MLDPKKIVWLVVDWTEGYMQDKYLLFTTKELAIQYLKDWYRTEYLRLIPCNDNSEYSVFPDGEKDISDEEMMENYTPDAVIIAKYIHPNLVYINTNISSDIPE